MGSNTLTELREKRTKILSAAEDVLTAAKDAGRDLTDDETATVERAHDAVRDLDKQIKGSDLVSRVLSLGSADDIPGDGTGFKALSPGAWARKAARRMRGITDDDSGAGTPLSKSVQSGSWTLPSVLVDFVRDADQATNLLQLIPRKAATANFGYIQQVTRTNNAAFVADAATKPTSVFTFREVLDHLRVLAHLSEPIPIRFQDDYSEHMELIRTELTTGLMPKLEAQVIGGDGTGENLLGLLNVSGVQTQPFATDAVTTIRKARTALQTSDEVPSAWVFHPVDAEALDLTREDGATGDFLTLTRVLGDIPFVTSNGLTPGQAVLGDFNQSRLYVGEQSRFDVDTSGALFDTNTLKMRAEGRFGFAVLRPVSFVLVDLTAA